MGLARSTILGKAATGGGIKGGLAARAAKAANARQSGSFGRMSPTRFGGRPKGGMIGAAMRNTPRQAPMRRSVFANRSAASLSRPTRGTVKGLSNERQARLQGRMQKLQGRMDRLQSRMGQGNQSSFDPRRRSQSASRRVSNRHMGYAKLGSMRGGSMRGGGFGAPVRPSRGMGRPSRQMAMDSRFAGSPNQRMARASRSSQMARASRRA
jgi:hypothetical protein